MDMEFGKEKPSSTTKPASHAAQLTTSRSANQDRLPHTDTNSFLSGTSGCKFSARTSSQGFDNVDDDGPDGDGDGDGDGRVVYKAIW
ncbi:uncharacterized protein PADG_11539 [Paracoccidioides brasiliensis Pb18]|uniref:Uncharacterized protein n=1 Tax=Paracoccidioides brasiliensis (strain Pb18) TaxID=502780 RepID=A0A0A0HUQ9_PARBD|nr:uncharacterized protein PADG_11539 [Paracoccidioides brasiliensis Pb18]KGM92342.1 hypothetical protein PADG_11539 [Paracoccidioides brasiliensis Pb18]